MAGEPKTYTQDEIDALVASKIEETTAGLKANQTELLKAAKAAKAKLASYEGVDPDEFKRLKANADEAERKRLTAEGDFTKLREQLVERHSQELGAKDKHLGKYQSALGRRLTTDELRKALTGKVLPEYAELLVEHGAKFLRVRETDDDFDYEITDGKGNVVVADGKGSAMTMDLFVDQTLKAKYPGAFAGTGSSGGGATKSTGGAGGAAAKTVVAGDNKGFLENLADIATGKVDVV